MKKNLKNILLTTGLVTGLSFHSYSQSQINIKTNDELATDIAKTLEKNNIDYFNPKNKELIDSLVKREVNLDISNRIVYDDTELKNLALSITKDCLIEDNECKTINIYNYIQKNYKKIDDVTNEAKFPKETINEGGGDCEDFAILNNSLLENIGIKTKIIFSSNHAYSLVYGLNIENLVKKREEFYLDKIYEVMKSDTMRDILLPDSAFTLLSKKLTMKEEIKSYNIDEKNWISVDPTIEGGYIGLENAIGKKMIIDSRTKEINYFE